MKSKIKNGWYGAGDEVEILGEPITVNGMEWTPVLEDGEEDPTFHKTAGIEETQEMKDARRRRIYAEMDDEDSRR